MRILVVDDEEDVQFLFEQKFRKEINSGAIDFVFTFSGESALSYLKEHMHEAILILSDINMPGMTGFQLLKEIKILHPTPPPVIMMITAYGDQENFDEAKKLGANDFLTKPLNFIELKEKLNKCMLLNDIQ
jgi:two-component system, chemotaxis family, chemotaxis protein CheY